MTRSPQLRGVGGIGEARAGKRIVAGLGGALNSLNLTPLRAFLESSQQHLPG
jgi:hypothetical protein